MLDQSNEQNADTTDSGCPDSFKIISPAEVFLRTLWGDDPPDGTLVIKRKNGETVRFHIDQLQGAVKKIEEIKLFGDIFFAPGLRNNDLEENKTGTAESVIAIPGLWFDLDYVKDAEHAKDDLPADSEQALNFIGSFPLKPSVIIATGGGYHCYWLFKEPWLFDTDKERQEALILSERFQGTLISAGKDNGWNLDRTSALSYLLRLPGTFNCKRPEDRRKVTIYQDNVVRYNPDDFEDFLIDPAYSCATPSNTKFANNDDQGNKAQNQNRKVLEELTNRCEFLKHCKNNAENLSEPEWHKMICILGHEYEGFPIIHELSKPYPNYTAAETEKKIIEVLKRNTGPVLCETLTNYCSCEMKCQVSSPTHLKQQIVSEFGITQNTQTTIPVEDTFEDIDLLKERIPDLPFPWESLPLSLANCFKDLGQDLSVVPEMCAVVGLGILSAAIGSKIQKVQAKKGYHAPLNLWIAIIAESGAKKTPVLSRMMAPVHELQKEIHKKYEKEYQQWKQKKSKDKKNFVDPEPKLPSYYTTEATMEALIELLVDNIHGIMLFQDEISSFLLDFNKYRGGKGGDREQYLQLWNSQPIKVDRVSKRLFVPNPFLSLLGGLQPRKAVRVFGDDSFDDGLISRFLFYNNPNIYIELTNHEWSDANKELWTSLIKSFYTSEASFPNKLVLSEEAWIVFQNYENSINKIGEFVPYTFKLFIPKSSNYVLRIAGILHVVCWFSGKWSFPI